MKGSNSWCHRINENKDDAKCRNKPLSSKFSTTVIQSVIYSTTTSTACCCCCHWCDGGSMLRHWGGYLLLYSVSGRGYEIVTSIKNLR